jgi:hypothetical protein
MKEFEKRTIQATLEDYFPKFAGIEANEAAVASALARAHLPISVLNARKIIPDIQATLVDTYREAFRRFYEQTGFAACEANRSVLEREHHGEPVTLETLLELAEHPQIKAQLASTPRRDEMLADQRRLADEARERTEIIAELTARLLDDKGKPSVRLGRENISPTQSYRIEVERINGSSLLELRAMRERIETERELRNAPIGELRRLAREECRATHPRPSRYLPLPPMFVPPGKDESCAVPWTATLLKRLDAQTMRRLMERHGADAINEVLREN